MFHRSESDAAYRVQQAAEPAPSAFLPAITLRDWMAGMVLVRMLPTAHDQAERLSVQEYAGDYARVAYFVADAMEVARNANT